MSHNINLGRRPYLFGLLDALEGFEVIYDEEVGKLRTHGEVFTTNIDHRNYSKGYSDGHTLRKIIDAKQ